MSDLDKLNINESNIHEMVLVKDASGNEFVCNLKDLVSAKNLSEDQKQRCVQNVEPADK